VHPPPSPDRANFTLITECTPESSGCYSVYSVVVGVSSSIEVPSYGCKFVLLLRTGMGEERREKKISNKVKLLL
jgi:hypothetical protein